MPMISHLLLCFLRTKSAWFFSSQQCSAFLSCPIRCVVVSDVPSLNASATKKPTFLLLSIPFLETTILLYLVIWMEPSVTLQCGPTQCLSKRRQWLQRDPGRERERGREVRKRRRRRNRRGKELVKSKAHGKICEWIIVCRCARIEMQTHTIKMMKKNKRDKEQLTYELALVSSFLSL